MRDAEVGDDDPVFREQHVVGLQVAVHDAGVVGAAQRPEDRLADGGRPGDRQRTVRLQDRSQ
ncbi:hypothetical protein V3664_24590 [Streptomyces sp. CS62]